jgi:hypothetical protein
MWLGRVAHSNLLLNMNTCWEVLHHLWYLVSYAWFCHYFEVFMWYPILGCMLVIVMANTSLLVSPHDTWRLNAFTNILAWVCSIMLWGAWLIMLRGVCLCYTMVYKLTKVSHKWSLTLVCSRISSFCIVERKHVYMSLIISILTNIFFLHTKTQNFISSIPNVLR